MLCEAATPSGCERTTGRRHVKNTLLMRVQQYVRDRATVPSHDPRAANSHSDGRRPQRQPVRARRQRARLVRAPSPTRRHSPRSARTEDRSCASRAQAASYPDRCVPAQYGFERARPHRGAAGRASPPRASVVCRSGQSIDRVRLLQGMRGGGRAAAHLRPRVSTSTP